MKLAFVIATNSDAAELAALHSSVAQHLTREFGQGFWSSSPSERVVLNNLRRPKFERTILARASDGRIIAALRLATKKPWAIDTAYFSAVKRPLYLTGMAVHPDMQRKGIGGFLMKEAVVAAQAWPADAIRLDAFDAKAGASPFYVKCGFREVARVVYRKNPLVYLELVLTQLR